VASKVDLELLENDDTEVIVTLTTNKPEEGTPLDLTDHTVEVVLKVSAPTPDGDAASWLATSVSEPERVVVTDETNGVVKILFPHGKVTTSMGAWRVTGISSEGLRKTGVYGAVTVVDT